MTKNKIFGLSALALFVLILAIAWPTKSDKSALLPVSGTSVSQDDSYLPPEVDYMAALFEPYASKLPITETITYAGRVDWLSGRPAYLGDYAAHYKTSKHFISRSLHGTGNYLSSVVSRGDRFSVIRADKAIEFHLVLDISRLKIWVYCLDKEEATHYLLKSYPVCAGLPDPASRSGFLTPLGTYQLGEEIAVYKEGTMGNFKNQLTEMVTIFGVRWIPFAREIAGCTAPSKGFGLHGMPWDRVGEELHERRDLIGTYTSSGCIRLLTEDIEELFAVIVSRPSYIHVVKDFLNAQIPGKEGSFEL